MVKNVSVLVGAGSIGQAIIRLKMLSKPLRHWRMLALPQGDTLKIAYLALL